MKKYFAEFLGTFALVLVGTGAIVLHEEFGNISHMGISIAFGGIVFLMIVLFGKISGAHINPAVTVGLLIEGSFPKKKIIGFLVAQLFGATIASIILFLIFNNKNLGSTFPRDSWQEAFIWELFMTFILMYAILLIGKIKRINSFIIALVIGSIIFLEAYIGGPISGASMNPARSFGPAIISGNLDFLWLYFLAPIAGSLLALFVNKIRL